jgi:hypothetical protein
MTAIAKQLFCAFFVIQTLRPADGLKTGLDLLRLYAQQVDRRLEVPEAEQHQYAELAAQTLSQEGMGSLPSQFVLLVDRSALIQAVMLYWKSDDGMFHFIGASPVSTGKPGQFEHFVTPTGVFEHSVDNPDFRAEGTLNEFGIRGYGRKGMRIYDFGWVQAPKGWGDHTESVMRLQMHATDPDILEPRLGNALSKGCIRIPAKLNTFIDRYGLIDAGYEEVMAEGKSLWVLLPDREPTPWPGRYLVVVETERDRRPLWSIDRKE